jgi:probable phosphoglycerate mutase
MKEFYFVRHGQTDVNIGKILGDQPHVPLNETGRTQIQNLKENFPAIDFELVCESPLLRVKQTADILLGADHPTPRVIIDELRECTWHVWCQMESLKFRFENHSHKELAHFLDQVERAAEVCRSHEKKLLIVAHGGVYNALLHHLEIKWNRHIENGELAHFTRDEQWSVKSLYVPYPREEEYQAYEPGLENQFTPS